MSQGREVAGGNGPPVEDGEGGEAIRQEVEIASPAVLTAISGNLRTYGRALGIELGMRGNTLLLAGERARVLRAKIVMGDMASVMERVPDLTDVDIARALAAAADDPTLDLQALFGEGVVIPARKKAIFAKGITQRLYINAIRSHDLTFGIGPAGTGKTYLAMALAVQALLERRCKRIVLARPAVEAGERLGFLPGDLAEKVNPYLRPLYDALFDMMDAEKASALIARGNVEVAPLAFMRGRTLNDSFIILDEAQNATSDQMRMFLTRLGYSSKAVVTGDVTQVDLPSGQRSGLAEARELLGGVEGIAFCKFTEVDVVRHPLVQRIVVAYDRRDAMLAALKAQRASTAAEPPKE